MGGLGDHHPHRSACRSAYRSHRGARAQPQRQTALEARRDCEFHWGARPRITRCSPPQGRSGLDGAPRGLRARRRDAWRMRQALQHLGITDPSGSNGSVGKDSANGRLLLSVLSLASDPGAIALGPQLAITAAFMGIPTALIIGAQEDIVATAALRTACAMPPSRSSKRPGNLQVIADYAAEFDGRFRADLTVYVAVVDDRSPQMTYTARGGTTILGVSAGAATADQIAQVAVNAAAHGSGIAGILVADPEPADHTTGLVPQLARPTNRSLPTRLSGSTTEIRQ